MCKAETGLFAKWSGREWAGKQMLNSLEEQELFFTPLRLDRPWGVLTLLFRG
jgi:hypothetical protein